MTLRRVPRKVARLPALRGPERDRVVLVDRDGRALGERQKLAAHQAPGHLHLAISALLFDDAGRVLLQRRAPDKYHFPRVWANSCCSHPQPGEDPALAAVSRVREELGIDCELSFAGRFVYRATCATSGLVEHELDLVYVGALDSAPDPDPDEVEELCLVDPAALRSGTVPGDLAPWLPGVLALGARAWSGTR